MKRAWRRVDGVLLLDKPRGMTSNAALQAVRRMFRAARAGHTGTLDPMATGLLPLCFGEATKFSSDLLDADKTYEAEIRFGVTTDTGDAEGEILERRAPRFTPADLEAALAGFRGRTMQVPPMYSALKRGGQPLYKLARQGVTVERQAREINIAELALLDHSADLCRLRVTCGKGTYIRALAEDIGRALGCGAHLAALRRMAVGGVSVARAATLDDLAALPDDARERRLLPPDTLLRNLPEIRLDEARGQRFRHGNPVAAGGEIRGKCRVYAESELLGVGHADDAGIVHPQRLVASR
ncbi:MAG: tRNA pseudouridine(55) synthase TruB [Candidatus Accumulibacter sp.]|jgi:tRNA pseudouridine55 synthase|nr:tRNA pseudouridine(55) synthase TruB [Accumulibacter sp.]